MSSDSSFVLYGSHASYATAKTRSYLRKKGIPFVERLPAAKRFREYVRPTSENHRIPQLEAPDGTVVQDTIAIFDHLEERFPEPPAYPTGARQQLVARLFEVLLDAELGRVAWHYRWNYMDENYSFVGREFGRSFRPQGTNDELDHYGGVIADRMEGKRASFGDSEALWPVLEMIYLQVLEILEAHFTEFPYLFGGLPSIADHVLMGPLFGHLARDPEPSRLMKLRAPRVFRWTEHMNTPEIQSPEFSEYPMAYLSNDEIPETVVSLLKLCLSDIGPGLLKSAEIYNAWVDEHSDRPSVSPISSKGHDEAVVGQFEDTLRGIPLVSGAGTYPLWVLQRGLEWFHQQDEAAREAGRHLLEDCQCLDLLDTEFARRLTRVGSRMALE
ncbi:glutathione S-transferase family protein [Myxococcota bacterium]|nr:glutathione S-transferase family protein [Myxococcota bacterium]